MIRIVLSEVRRIWWALALDVLIVGGFVGAAYGPAPGLAAGALTALVVPAVAGLVVWFRFR